VRTEINGVARMADGKPTSGSPHEQDRERDKLHGKDMAVVAAVSGGLAANA
jgi:hypothetical protein